MRPQVLDPSAARPATSRAPPGRWEVRDPEPWSCWRGGSPDLAAISPSGNRIFVSLRGPNPLSGSPHVATGSTPGLGVIQVTQGGRAGALKSVVRISNIDAAGVERADAHGIRVRLK
jgi:hypothetical protein